MCNLRRCPRLTPTSVQRSAMMAKRASDLRCGWSSRSGPVTVLRSERLPSAVKVPRPRCCIAEALRTDVCNALFSLGSRKAGICNCRDARYCAFAASACDDVASFAASLILTSPPSAAFCITLCKTWFCACESWLVTIVKTCGAVASRPTSDTSRQPQENLLSRAATNL